MKKKKIKYRFMALLFAALLLPPFLPCTCFRAAEVGTEEEGTEEPDETEDGDMEEDTDYEADETEGESITGNPAGEAGDDEEFLEGDYNTTGKATIQKGHGYVTFVGHVNDNISENIFLEFWNLENYKVYKYYVYSINNYTTSVELPAGSYMIMDGGLFYDTKAEYPIDNVAFEVEPNTASVVDFGVGMKKNQIGEYVQNEEYVELTIENEDGSADVYGMDGNTYEGHYDDLSEGTFTPVERIQSVSANDIIVKPKKGIGSIILSTIPLLLIMAAGGIFLYRHKSN